jgi:hypothetical protein
MKTKFKYIPFRYQHEIQDLKEEFPIVKNPFGMNMKNGEYLIRGDKKSHSRKYWVIDNVWFLISDTKKDNGHYDCIAGKYHLFPSLSEKEWDLLNKPLVFKKLSPYWKRAVLGRNHWMSLREIGRDVRKSFLQFEKENQ